MITPSILSVADPWVGGLAHVLASPHFFRILNVPEFTVFRVVKRGAAREKELCGARPLRSRVG